MVVHKAGKETATRYAGFGQYEQIKAPLCVGAKGVYAGNSYHVSSYWKNVTCKHCLRKNK